MRDVLIRIMPLLLLASCASRAEEQTAPVAEKSSKEPASGAYDFSRELTADEARELIPRAASLSRREFQQILEETPVELREITNQSLTAILLAVNPEYAEKQYPESRRAFHYIGSPDVEPEPQLLRAAVEGDSEADYASIVQPGYLGACTCVTRSDSASGRFSFRAARLYAGEAQFTARRIGDDWQIVSFDIPEYRLKTARQADGSWKLDNEELLLGIESP